MRNLPLLLILSTLPGVAAIAQDATLKQQRLEAQQHYERGTELMRAESFEQAAAEFKQAIHLDPQFLLAHYSLGQCYMSLKRYPEAVSAYVAGRDAFLAQANLDDKQRAAIDRERREHIAELKQALDIVRQQAGRGGTREPIEAIRLETRISLLQSADNKDTRSVHVPAELSLALGSAYFRQGLLPDATREYRAAIDVNPKLGAAHNNLAAVLMLQGQFGDARSAVKAAEKAGYAVSPELKADLKKSEDAAKAKKP